MAARVFSSRRILGVASDLCRRSRENLDDVRPAIILAAASVEAMLNDLSGLAATFSGDERSKNLHDLLEAAEVEHCSAGFKLRLGLFALNGTLPSRGDTALQDCEALFAIRNLVIHPRPESVRGLPGDEADEQKLKKPLAHLRNRGVIAIPEGKPYTDADLLESAVVATWAVNVAISLFQLFVQSIEPTTIFWTAACRLTEGLTPLPATSAP